MRVSELTQRYRPREGHIDVSTIYTNILYDDPAQNLRIESVLSDRSIPSGLTANNTLRTITDDITQWRPLR
jgi:hypothetical protein